MTERIFMNSRLVSLTHARQRGLTLLELMVAMVIALVVVLAALAAMLFAREGFSTIDSSSQLRENARFLTELISRVVIQAGYRSTTSGPISRSTNWYPPQLLPPDIEGFDNSVTTANATSNPIASGSVVARSASTCGASDTSCVNGSDILVVRFQGENKPDGSADGSMINCSGKLQGHDTKNQTVSDVTNVFYVQRSASTEPVLMCATLDAGTWQAQPLISGVESFQVLYGTDGVTPNVAVANPAANTAAAVPVPNPPDRWLRADQIVVAGDSDGTKRNWRRVTDIRIGLVLRGLPSQGSSQARTVYPFSEGASSPFAVSADAGTVLAVPADRRLRQTVTFNVHLRNTL